MIQKSGVKRIIILGLAGSWVAPMASLAQDEPAGFVQVVPSTIRWRPSPAVPGSYVAVLLGDPQKAGPFVIRVKLVPGARVMPHTHSQARTYTVLAGDWKLGFGERYDAAALRSFPPGSLYRLPAKVAHFQAAGPVETIVQIDSVGPSSTDFINPLDDPRRR